MAYPVACVFIHPCHSFAAELMIFFLYYDIHICSFGLVCGHVDNSEMEQVMYVSHNTGWEVACPSGGFGDNRASSAYRVTDQRSELLTAAGQAEIASNLREFMFFSVSSQTNTCLYISIHYAIHPSIHPFIIPLALCPAVLHGSACASLLHYE